MGPSKTTATSNGVHKPPQSLDCIPPSEESSPEIRSKMKQYWEIYSPSIESMMLSHDAPHLSVEEQKEVMGYLPQRAYVGKNVLELGAGIGRYTTLLSEGGAAHVTAVDFMESYVQENTKINGHRDNVTLLCADVTKLSFQPRSFDLVFSNWLLMYLTDREVVSLLQRALAWLKPGGYLFVRESCYHQSGNVKRGENPTLYRTPLDYSSMLDGSCADGARYRLLKAKSILTYIRHYRNPNQLTFVVRREDPAPVTASAPPGGADSQQQARDNTDSAVQALALRETVSGKTWISTGGCKVAQCLANRLGGGSSNSLKDKSVLAVNCGSGGLVFLLAEQGAARVHGLASDPVELHYCLRHHGAMDKDTMHKLSFELCLPSEWETSERYDLVCAHDFDLTSDGCARALQQLTALLKKGGKLVLTTYTSTAAAAAGRAGSVLASSEQLSAAASSAGLSSVTVSSCSLLLPALSQQLATLTSLTTAAPTDTKSATNDEHSPALRETYAKQLREKVLRLESGEITFSILEALH